jgi:hypothetical protein
MRTYPSFLLVANYLVLFPVIKPSSPIAPFGAGRSEPPTGKDTTATAAESAAAAADATAADATDADPATATATAAAYRRQCCCRCHWLVPTLPLPLQLQLQLLWLQTLPQPLLTAPLLLRLTRDS